MAGVGTAGQQARGMWWFAIGGLCLPDTCANRSVVDVPAHPTVVKSNDLWCESRQLGAEPWQVPGSRSGAVGIGATNGINLPFLHVLMHNAFDEFGIPPDLGIVLQSGMVHGDASLGVDAQGLTRPLEFMYPRVADSIIITCVASSALMAKHAFKARQE